MNWKVYSKASSLRMCTSCFEELKNPLTYCEFCRAHETKHKRICSPASTESISESFREFMMKHERNNFQPKKKRNFRCKYPR